jgi:DNA polymerase-3 subunit epsilon
VIAINDYLADLARRYERMANAPWPLADIHTPDLFRAVAKQLGDTGGIVLTLVGVPAWVHADSHSLVLALKHLIVCIAKHADTTAFDIGATRRDDLAHVEIVWKGRIHLTSTVIESWLDEPLKGTIGNRTVRQIVERHSSEVWSQQLPEGRYCLRLPLRAATRPKVRERPDRLVPMPEHYDFDLFEVSRAAIKDLSLRKLDMVVFDTETTGLKPNEGDALLSIGAVRVVNGRILTGETFERLINPGRNIPASSTDIHGITAEMVRDKPPADVVLPQFKTFVGDSVLVAYNAAFDMRFLEVAAMGSDLAFTNPVLDALFLASYLHRDEADYSLSATAHRLGVDVIGRHTALGDAMTTAAILVKLIELLHERGVDTLGEAAQISSRMMELQRQRAKLA